MDLNNFREVDKYIGISNQYANYYNKNLLIFDDNKLYLKRISGFSELIDRALTLASGYNRKIENYLLVYANINVGLAELLSEKTGLNLEVRKNV